MTDLDPLARALARLSPTPAAISRDRLQFEAGRAMGARMANRWKLATGASLAASVMLAVLGFTRPPEVEVRHEIVHVTPPSPPPSIEPPAVSDAARWLNLRDAVLARGLDELPPAPPGNANLATLRAHAILD